MPKSWTSHLTNDPWGTADRAETFDDVMAVGRPSDYHAGQARNYRVTLARAAALSVRSQAGDLTDACRDLVPNTRAQADELLEHVKLARQSLDKAVALLEAVRPIDERGTTR